MGLVKVSLDGFPIVHNKIELPSLAEIIKIPIYQKMEANRAYDIGGEIIRYLIDNTPLKNDKKNILIWSSIHLLNKDTTSIKYNNRWHVDGTNCPFGKDDDRYFLIMNDCSATTEFNESPIEHMVDESISHLEYDDYINTNAELLGIVPKRVPVSSFIEFGQRSAHRATKPTKDEFRLLFRVCESNTMGPLSDDKSIMPASLIFSDHSKSNKSIEHLDSGAIKIYL